MYFEEWSVTIPSLNQNPPLVYKINNLLSLCTTFRLLFLIRIYLNSSIFMTSRGFRLWLIFFSINITSWFSKIYGVNYSYMYTVRCLMKNQPLKHLIGCLCFGILIFAYILKICESANQSKTMDFSYYSNCLWCVIITMTTSKREVFDELSVL